MKYYEKLTLRNGQECILRNATAKDAKVIKEHRIMVAGETDYMLRYPDELTMTEEEEAKKLEKTENSVDEIHLIAELDGKLVANAGIHPVGRFDRLKHKADFGVSVKKAYWGLGLGTLMLEKMIMLAREAGYQKMNLEVIAGNEKAIKIYEKYGFKLYGTEEKGFRYRDNTYATVYYMHMEL